MTTANCGTADSGLGASSPNGNAGRLIASTSCNAPASAPGPTSANGNAGSVIPSIQSQPTVPGGSLVTPPLPQPQLTAIVLQQAGISAIVLVGN